jgi:hypothetical protein
MDSSSVLSGFTAHHGHQYHPFRWVNRIRSGSSHLLLSVGVRNELSKRPDVPFARRTFFKGWLLSSCAVCLMTAALNLTVLLISQLIGIPMGSPIFAIPISSVVLRMAVGLLYQFATFLLFISLGYLLSVLFYRLNKMGRWIVGILLGCTLLALLYYLAQFDSVLDRLYLLPYQHPLLSSSIYLLISLAVLSLCWLMVRSSPSK